jgi:hypothetical protein
MGFFSELGKQILGQPVAPNQAQQSNSAPQGQGVVDEQGHKIIPEIDITDLRSHLDGDKLTVTAWVANRSDQHIRVDSCYLLKQKKQFNQELGPNQSHELTLYQGPAPHDENEHQAHIVYRLHVNGDSFQNNYRIDYHLESDGVRIINELRKDGPVRDI